MVQCNCTQNIIYIQVLMKSFLCCSGSPELISVLSRACSCPIDYLLHLLSLSRFLAKKINVYFIHAFGRFYTEGEKYRFSFPAKE